MEFVNGGNRPTVGQQWFMQIQSSGRSGRRRTRERFRGSLQRRSGGLGRDAAADGDAGTVCVEKYSHHMQGYTINYNRR